MATSNERDGQGQGQGVRVGDRVRFDWFGRTHEGVLTRFWGNGYANVQCEYGGYNPPVADLTLISRAPTPDAYDIRPGDTVYCIYSPSDGDIGYGLIGTVAAVPDGQVLDDTLINVRGDDGRDYSLRFRDLMGIDRAPTPEPAPVATREWCSQCDNTGYVTYSDGSTDPCRECEGTGYVIRHAPTPEPAPDASEPAQTAADKAALADANLDSFDPWRQDTAKRPTVVCLCGSTRFSEAFREANLRETLEGRIVLSIGCDMRSDTEIFGGMEQSELDATKRRLDDLHRRKIDLADEILVLNVGGYIGESTSSEIAYARKHGKRIRYLEGLDTEPTTPPASEPARTVDAQAVELPVKVICGWCNGAGGPPYEPGGGLCEHCGGAGVIADTIELDPAALDTLARALMPRMVRDIRMIANDRP